MRSNSYNFITKCFWSLGLGLVGDFGKGVILSARDEAWQLGLVRVFYRTLPAWPQKVYLLLKRTLTTISPFKHNVNFYRNSIERKSSQPNTNIHIETSATGLNLNNIHSTVTKALNHIGAEFTINYIAIGLPTCV